MPDWDLICGVPSDTPSGDYYEGRDTDRCETPLLASLFRPVPGRARQLPDYVPLFKPQPGRPAPPGSDLAKARIAAHAAFDPLWQSGRMTRTKAYSELARRLGIPKHLAHMQMFDKATCERVIALFLVDDFETLEDDFSDLL